jgi:phospholipid/cholesterol/gamma-HCH transport system substrate-binding protein
VIRFRERNQTLLGGGCLLLILLLVVAALNVRKLPLLNDDATYTAEFANSGGLRVNDNVTVAGVTVGSVTAMALAGDRVRVTFTADRDVDLGNETSAAAKVLAVVGTQFLELTPAGRTPLRGAIPTSRTTVPYTFVDTLQQLSTTTEQYDLPQLVAALQAGSQVLSGTTSADTTAALTGLASFSSTLAQRKADLSTIVTQGAGLAKTLSDHRTQLVDLIGQGDLVLQVLQARRAALQQLFDGTTSLSSELIRVVGPNRDDLRSLLDNLQTVARLLARDTESIDRALPLLGAFSRYAANATGSGAFVDANIPTMLLPDTLLAQCRQPGAYPAAGDEQRNALVGCRP